MCVCVYVCMCVCVYVCMCVCGADLGKVFCVGEVGNALLDLEMVCDQLVHLRSGFWFRVLEKVRRSLDVAERRGGGMIEIFSRRSIRHPPSLLATFNRCSDFLHYKRSKQEIVGIDEVGNALLDLEMVCDQLVHLRFARPREVLNSVVTVCTRLLPFKSSLHVFLRRD